MRIVLHQGSVSYAWLLLYRVNSLFAQYSMFCCTASKRAQPPERLVPHWLGHCLGLGHLPLFRLHIDKPADHLHDQRVD